MGITKEVCLQQINELLIQHNAAVRESAERMLRSGAVNPQDYGEDYRLAKIAITAALRDKHDCFRPLHEEDKATVRNLEHF